MYIGDDAIFCAAIISSIFFLNVFNNKIIVIPYRILAIMRPFIIGGVGGWGVGGIGRV